MSLGERLPKTLIDMLSQRAKYLARLAQNRKPENIERANRAREKFSELQAIAEITLGLCLVYPNTSQRLTEKGQMDTRMVFDMSKSRDFDGTAKTDDSGEVLRKLLEPNLSNPEWFGERKRATNTKKSMKPFAEQAKLTKRQQRKSSLIWRMSVEAQRAAHLRHYMMFITLTLSPEECGQAGLMRLPDVFTSKFNYWQNFIDKMKRRCTGFRYAAVLEDGPTKDNPHVHVMCIMEDVPKTWKNHTIAKENPMENRESAHGNIDIGYFWPLGIVQAKPFRLGRFDIWSKTGWPEAEYYDVKVATTPEAMLKVKTTYGPPTMAGAYIAKYLDKVEDTTHRVKTSMGFGLDVIKEAIASMEQRDYRPLTEGLTAPGTKPTRLSQVENPFGMEGQNFPPQSVISTIARAERERVLWENKPGLMLGQQTYERKNNLYQEVAAAVESAGESDPSDYVHKNTEELAYERMSHPDRRERAWRTLAQKLGYDPERFDFETRRKEPEIESTAIPELGEFHKNLEPATESIPAHKMASDLATRFQRHHYEEKKRDADAA